MRLEANGKLMFSIYNFEGYGGLPKPKRSQTTKFVVIQAPGVMQTLSNFCWAYASLGISPPAHLLTKLLGFVRCLSFDCPVQEVSSILWACSVFLAIGMDIEKEDIR